MAQRPRARALDDAKLPPCADITPGSRWAQLDARLWDESDTLLPKKWPSFFHGTPLISLLTALQRDTVIVTGCTTSGVRARDDGGRVLLRPARDPAGGLHRRPGPRDAHESNLRDVHRRYAEVTTSDEVIAYLQRLPQLSPA